MRHILQISFATGFIKPVSLHNIRTSPNMSRNIFRDSGEEKKISLRTDRGMSNSFQKVRGGTMMAEHRTRIVKGTYSDSQKRLKRDRWGTRLRRYSCANEMCRAS